MLDLYARSVVDPFLIKIAGSLHNAGLTANQATWISLVVTIFSFPFLAIGLYWGALFFIVLNRFFDGIDGHIARIETPDIDNAKRDVGGYMDIVFDFVMYGGFVIFFALGQGLQTGQYIMVASFLLFAYLLNAVAFLSYASIIAKRGEVNTQERTLQKSFYFLSGLAEGTETIIYMVLCCLFPAYFTVFTAIFALICFVSAGARVRIAMSDLATK